MAIINVHPYQDSHLSPTLFNWTSLQERYPSPQAAITAHTDAVRAALSYTSFLIWWTSSIHDWTIELPELMVYNVCQLVNSCRSQWCSVLVDLHRDWRGIGLAHWIVNNIPVYYPWNQQITTNDCFLCLSPIMLFTAIPSPPHDRDSDIIMAGTSISEDTKLALSLYNEFLQEIKFPDDHKSKPLLSSDNFSIYWIVDFWGWECRPLDSIRTVQEYSNHYHWVSECDSIQRFTMWRFCPCYTSALVLWAGVKWSGVSKDCQWSDREICKLCKVPLAPHSSQRFNLGGWMISTTISYNEPLPKHIMDHELTKHKKPTSIAPAQNRHSLLSWMLLRDTTRTQLSSRATTSTSAWSIVPPAQQMPHYTG